MEQRQACGSSVRRQMQWELGPSGGLTFELHSYTKSSNCGCYSYDFRKRRTWFDSRRITQQYQNTRVGVTGDPGENSPTSGIVRHDSHVRKRTSDPAGTEHSLPWREASALATEPPRRRLHASQSQSRQTIRTIHCHTISNTLQRSSGETLNASFINLEATLSQQVADARQTFRLPQQRRLGWRRRRHVRFAGRQATAYLARETNVTLYSFLIVGPSPNPPHPQTGAGATTEGQAIASCAIRYLRADIKIGGVQEFRPNKSSIGRAGIAASQKFQRKEHLDVAVKIRRALLADRTTDEPFRGVAKECDVLTVDATPRSLALQVAVHRRSRVYCTCLLCSAPMRMIVVRMSRAGMKGRGKREIPEKTRQPMVSSGTIPTFENPVTRPGIEPGSPWWELLDDAARVKDVKTPSAHPLIIAVNTHPSLPMDVCSNISRYNVGTPFANHRQVTYSPAGSPADRQSLPACSRQSRHKARLPEPRATSRRTERPSEPRKRRTQKSLPLVAPRKTRWRRLGARKASLRKPYARRPPENNEITARRRERPWLSAKPQQRVACFSGKHATVLADVTGKYRKRRPPSTEHFSTQPYKQKFYLDIGSAGQATESVLRETCPKKTTRAVCNHSLVRVEGNVRARSDQKRKAFLEAMWPGDKHHTPVRRTSGELVEGKRGLTFLTGTARWRGAVANSLDVPPQVEEFLPIPIFVIQWSLVNFHLRPGVILCVSVGGTGRSAVLGMQVLPQRRRTHAITLPRLLQWHPCKTSISDYGASPLAASLVKTMTTTRRRKKSVEMVRWEVPGVCSDLQCGKLPALGPSQLGTGGHRSLGNSLATLLFFARGLAALHSLYCSQQTSYPESTGSLLVLTLSFRVIRLVETTHELPPHLRVWKEFQHHGCKIKMEASFSSETNSATERLHTSTVRGLVHRDDAALDAPRTVASRAQVAYA
ncbi:hypothetical protein PR048_002775 [Dryococelus australis]|uniref:Uncharacterized protein n=1 Tax=Dryococelus australis TaxID=614101 RepID=A0ABQ9IMK8_9NEOP|nr:hypothetical protein PR048_002775 [Dryococelus australis]